MSLILQNLQKIVTFDLVLLRSHIKLLRQIVKVESYDLSVTCVNDKEIADINNKYRHYNEPTDVLAFPFYENIEPGKLPTEPDHGILDLGDIYLGLPYIQRQCVSHDQKLQEVLPVMVTHGICHLIGYDHETEDQYKQMYEKESAILRQFNEITKYNCIPSLGIGHYVKE